MTRKFLPWAVAVAVVLTLAARVVTHFYPAPPSPLTLEVEFPAGRAGDTEPLITTGRFTDGDFLFVRYGPGQTIAIGYDSWGTGGPVSAPVKYALGKKIRLQIEMPALTGVYSHRRFAAGDHLRVTADDAVLLDADVKHHVRDAAAIWIGENPIGGGIPPRFHGAIFHDGRAWRGDASALFTWRERFFGWLRTAQWQVLGLIVLGGAIVALWPRRPLVAAIRTAVAASVRAGVQHRWFTVSAALCTVCFAWMVTTGEFQFDYPETFGVFYDFQAASLLQGRLDVPEPAISGEAFIHAGKYYGYFGVTPALLRVPFVIFDLGFGNWSRTFMLADYVACLAGSYLILLAIVTAVRGAGARPSGFAAALLTLNVGLGSTFFFLGSRAYIYHEAILCGAAFALFACWCALRHLAAPGGRWWVGSLVCGVLSVHARPPVGFFALTFLGVVALALAWRGSRAGLRRHLTLGALCAAGVASFNLLSYLKFETFVGCPLHLNVQYGPERLARIDGKEFHLSNLRFSAHTYLVRPNILFEPRFPWLYLGPSKPKPFFPEAKSDFADRTLAFPYAMPALFVLATAGCLLATAAIPAARPLVAITWLAIWPMTLAMFAAIATVHRYTADFCPFLVVGAALGLAGLDATVACGRAALRTLLVVATLWAVGLTAALTLHYQGEVIWGVDDATRDDYRALRQRVDAFFGVTPPPAGKPAR